jgi:hypothetical protein
MRVYDLEFDSYEDAWESGEFFYASIGEALEAKSFLVMPDLYEVAQVRFLGQYKTVLFLRYAVVHKIH